MDMFLLLKKERKLFVTDLKMVNGDKVWEKWQDVFNLEQVAAGQTVHGFLHIFLLLHHVPRDLQPKLLPQFLVIFRQVRTRLGQVYIYLWLINTLQVSGISPIQSKIYDMFITIWCIIWTH